VARAYLDLAIEVRSRRTKGLSVSVAYISPCVLLIIPDGSIMLVHVSLGSIACICLSIYKVTTTFRLGRSRIAYDVCANRTFDRQRFSSY